MANAEKNKNNTNVYDEKISNEDIDFFTNEQKKLNTKHSLKHFVENNKEMFNKLKAEYDYSMIVTFLNKKYNIKTTVNTLKTLLADTGNIYNKMNDEKLRQHYEILCKKLKINNSQSLQPVPTLNISKLNPQEISDLFTELFQTITDKSNTEKYSDILSIIRTEIIENTDFNNKDNLDLLSTKLKTVSKESKNILMQKAYQTQTNT